MDNGLKIILGCIIGFSIAGLVIALCSRKMLLVHGSRGKTEARFLWALFTLIRMYYFGYSNTLFVNPSCMVKVREEDREMRKNKTSKMVMVFEVAR